ncbi:TPA: MafI family immunity protein [Citrobacter freundii]|uniref:MafI family immunity protein n=1 Tax=Citrobacter freundii TaxID=546 RepID=UPI0015FAAA34|nr:MafI family immunity protein [Citrobacter freundii]EKX2185710.1 MafI family immunity protein [Citrobacter freundii]MBA7997296.1 MafI family immunity protein [Citrobacter freundii]MBJ8969565.1 MafI family immunity protein [Citrobacter freundii]WFV07894.1 MafI family immunity protein [Citrobacter freundii]WMY39297.1 MafI family immunity protein [Citrobacter freundii]
MNVEYKEIETNLFNLINKLNMCFTQSEINEVVEFIEYNEYGLALDTIIDIIVEENKKINNDIFDMIIKTSNIMELDPDAIGKKIAAYIL